MENKWVNVFQRIYQFKVKPIKWKFGVYKHSATRFWIAALTASEQDENKIEWVEESWKHTGYSVKCAYYVFYI